VARPAQNQGRPEFVRESGEIGKLRSEVFLPSGDQSAGDRVELHLVIEKEQVHFDLVVHGHAKNVICLVDADIGFLYRQRTLSGLIQKGFLQLGLGASSRRFMLHELAEFG
jgi:hypothetical protein